MAYYVKNNKMLWKTDVKIAKELGYSPDVITRLKQEPDPNKRQLIMRTARMKGE